MFSRLGRRLRKFVADILDIIRDFIVDVLWDSVVDAFKRISEAIFEPELPGFLRNSLVGLLGEDGARIATEFDETLRRAPWWLKIFFIWWAIPPVLFSYVSARLAGVLELVRQQELKQYVPTPLPPETVAQAVNRILMSIGEGVAEASRSGLDVGRFEILARLAKRKIDPSTIAEAVRRGILDYQAGEFYAATAGIDGLEFNVLFNLTRRLLDLSVLVNAAYKGVITFDEAKARAAQLGIDPNDMDIVLRSAREILPPGDLINAWLRGLMTDESLEANLAARGYNPDDIWLFKQLAFFIPPPSDLIRMAVREVFTPEVAERFGQYEDFPEAFREWAAKQGISDFWARAYWAAHWELPSITQAFEMFHRDVISREDLEFLLRSQDVMPFWRDKLVQIAYNPIGRIDILRMYQLGVIDKEEVERRYRHLGYHPDDAKVLAEYTVRLAAQREKDLSRTDIEELLASGLITDEQAKEMILRNGYSPEQADLIMARINMKIAQAEVADELEVIKTLFLEGELSLNDVAAELGKLELPGTAVDRFIAGLIRESRKRRRQLTPTQIREAIRRGLLDTETALNRLKALGYSDEDAGLLVELYRIGGGQE